MSKKINIWLHRVSPSLVTLQRVYISLLAKTNCTLHPYFYTGSRSRFPNIRDLKKQIQLIYFLQLFFPCNFITVNNIVTSSKLPSSHRPIFFNCQNDFLKSTKKWKDQKYLLSGRLIRLLPPYKSIMWCPCYSNYFTTVTCSSHNVVIIIHQPQKDQSNQNAQHLREKSFTLHLRILSNCYNIRTTAGARCWCFQASGTNILV